MKAVLPLVLLLAGCKQQPAPNPDTPGAHLEAAAVTQGLIADPAVAALGGAWARDSDRLCVTGDDRGDQRIGIVVDYGEGQGCGATGRVRRAGETLKVELRGGCRFDARFEGDRIVFPAEVPDVCTALCTGRATLAAVQVQRLSVSASEARMLRDQDGSPLCNVN